MQEPRTASERMLTAFHNLTMLYTHGGEYIASFATPWFQAPEMLTWGSRSFRLSKSDTIPGGNGEPGTNVFYYNEGANFVLLDELKLPPGYEAV